MGALGRALPYPTETLQGLPGLASSNAVSEVMIYPPLLWCQAGQPAVVRSAFWRQSLVSGSDGRGFRALDSHLPVLSSEPLVPCYSAKASVLVLLTATLDLLGRARHFWRSVSRTKHPLGSRAWGRFHFPLFFLSPLHAGQLGRGEPCFILPPPPQASALAPLSSGAWGGGGGAGGEDQGGDRGEDWSGRAEGGSHPLTHLRREPRPRHGLATN